MACLKDLSRYKIRKLDEVWDVSSNLSDPMGGLPHSVSVHHIKRSDWDSDDWQRKFYISIITRDLENTFTTRPEAEAKLKELEG